MKRTINNIKNHLGFNEVIVILTVTFAGLTVWHGERTLNQKQEQHRDMLTVELEKIKLEYRKLAKN